MRYGKITQTAWQRSVRRQLHTRGPEILFRPTPWETCSGLAAEGAGGKGFLWTEAHAYGRSGRTGFYAVLQAAGELAARGVRICSVSVRVLLRPDAEEEELRELTAGIEDACARLGICVSAFQGEVAPAAAQNTVFVTGAGTIWSEAETRETRESSWLETETRDAWESSRPGADPASCGRRDDGSGQEILLCGYAGLEGTLRVLGEAEEELKTRFVPAFLARTEALKDELVTPDQLLAAQRQCGRITAVRQIGSGGVLAALWELAEILHTGLETDLRAVALKQETVEICEFFRLNPYQMTSAGSFLIVTEDAETVLNVLEKAGARAGRLGVTKAQNARVITSGEETRYLDRPAPDELVRWTAERTGIRE